MMGNCVSARPTIAEIKTPLSLIKNYKIRQPFYIILDRTYNFIYKNQLYNWQIYDGEHHILICVNSGSPTHTLDIFIYGAPLTTNYLYYACFMATKADPIIRIIHPWTMYNIDPHGHDVNTWRALIKCNYLPKNTNDHSLRPYKSINLQSYYDWALGARHRSSIVFINIKRRLSIVPAPLDTTAIQAVA